MVSAASSMVRQVGSQCPQSFARFTAEDAKHDWVQYPTKNGWSCNKLKLVGRDGTMSGVVVTDARYETLKKWRPIDHFHSSYRTWSKSDVTSLDTDEPK